MHKRMATKKLMVLNLGWLDFKKRKNRNERRKKENMMEKIK